MIFKGGFVGYTIPKEKRELYIRASADYKSSQKSLKEIAGEYGLTSEGFRLYLKSEGLIKPKNQYKKSKLKDDLKAIEKLTTQADERISSLKRVLPAEVIENASEASYNLAQKGETLKRMMIENAIAINEHLKELIPSFVSAYDLKEASATLKNLNDTAGLFPRAPMIAIQNNLNSLHGTGEPAKRLKKPEIAVKVDFVGKKDDIK